MSSNFKGQGHSHSQYFP